ncbi:hypothetical protein SEPCBS119000_005338 [Sporothrix epigloea]|uniref:Uncharacterized protein n=1 Tax=Sporothrix epigloea TaxID=1892477 RepID=A0ABP0E018_9PEZI
MCRWIKRTYACHDQKYIVSKFCQKYIASRGKVCRPRDCINYREHFSTEVCSRCRNVMTDNHRHYIFQMYRRLKKSHPERNWDVLIEAAQRPSFNHSGFIG